MSSRDRSSRRHDPVAPRHGNNAAGPHITDDDRAIDHHRSEAIRSDTSEVAELVDDVVPTESNPAPTLRRTGPTKYEPPSRARRRSLRRSADIDQNNGRSQLDHPRDIGTSDRAS